MNPVSIPVLTLTTVGSLLLLVPGPGDPPDDSPKFAAPQRMMAGEVLMGVDRLYPSPVLHDAAGDGIADVVIGDLFGNVTVAKGAKGAVFGPDKPLKDRRGEKLKFFNW